MATLTSPGVSITVTDESFYAAAGTGTVPLIVIATAEDKTAPDGSSTAAYTTSATAGNVYLINSQRELLTNYGNPNFRKSGATPLHGDELNEYGLQAAYSFLGIANRAYVLRADIDLSELSGSTTAPTASPANGSYWLDTSATTWGLKEWSGSAWVLKSTLSPNKDQVTTGASPAPKASIGVDGNFAVVYQTSTGTTMASIKLFEKISGAWYQIGTTGWDSASSGDFQIARHTNIPTTKSGGGTLAAGDLFLQTNTLNNGSVLGLKLYNATTKAFTAQTASYRQTSAEAYADYGTASLGDLWFNYTSDDATVKLKRHNGASTLSISSSAAIADTTTTATGHTSGTVAIKLNINDRFTVNGASGYVNVTFHGFDTNSNGKLSVDEMVQGINSALSSANDANTHADKVVASNVSGKVTLINSAGTDINVVAGTVAGFNAADLGLLETNSNWEDLTFTSSAEAPTGTLADGTLWFDNLLDNTNIDIVFKGSDSKWNSYPYDVNIAASEPTVQSDKGSLVTGDLWIGSADLENYPKIYKYNSALAAGSRWVLVDNTDKVSADGIIFADMRSLTTQGAGVAMDSDAPNPAVYPLGILGWNKRLSGGNVKKYSTTNARWEDNSGNFASGAPKMLRKAQRGAVVTKLQAVLTANQEIRNETNRFNLIACPGYIECLDEMITLNTDRKETAFVVSDAPLGLSSDSTSTQAWATNTAVATANGEDGLVSGSAYAAVYYPHGMSTNLDGTNIVVPSSSIALRTIAYNDQVAFPWFAPAGFQRGVVSNATSTGYLERATGTFKAVSLNEGQRDSLYSNKLNPIANFPGRGINVFGQKTLSPTASALDRVNVARLVVYIRERLDDLVKPFLFEPNDASTRADAKAIVDRFLANLVTQRGLFDFVTVCDPSNNTAERIDRNELHIDIAIQPIKAIEFIYIPIRVQNTLGSTA
jgi:phage tail sheath protein FI